jgi:hypothetical protein
MKLAAGVASLVAFIYKSSLILGMGTTMESFGKLPGYTLCALLASLGWIIQMIGLSIAQSNVTFSKFNPYGLFWYFLMFNLFWILCVVLTIYFECMKTYKSTLAGLTLLALAFVPFNLNGALQLAQSSVAERDTSAGNGTLSAGLIIFVFPLFAFYFLITAGSESFLHAYELPRIAFVQKQEKETEDNA